MHLDDEALLQTKLLQSSSFQGLDCDLGYVQDSFALLTLRFFNLIILVPFSVDMKS